jgi:predicted DsbA family dithiol-disulfide isomerase
MSEVSVIEVVSDVVCPWCFIGKRRLEKALDLLGRKDVRVQWKPFQLNPNAPKEGFDRPSYRARKFGSLAYAQQLEDHVRSAGAEDGIQFQFERIAKVPNTFEAHRLIWLAGREGDQDAVAEKLFQAYFIDAQDISSLEVLKSIGIASGLSAARLDEFFASREGEAEIREEEQQARKFGVSGVPSFFINGTPITSGAQRPEALAAAFGPELGPVVAQCSTDGVCS